MRTNLAWEPEIQNDAFLVELSLAGDREAFGQIVARYQSPICALAYSACGSVARSEDIAQDIFIAAWRKLDSLQEPSKFKAWLYGIARNLIHNAFRQHIRNPVANAELLDDASEPVSSADKPDEQVISSEEQAILWHVLSSMPQIYREPMVLFYRQNESIPQVADVLAISEEAVRQRLSRGRTLLTDRVTRVVQSGLRRSGPANTFAVAVVASLPALAAATSAKGAIVGMAATESATGQSTGFVGLLKSVGFFAAIVAIPVTLGSYFGHKLSQDANGLPHRRRSVSQFWRVFGIGMLVFLFFPLLLTFGVTWLLPAGIRAGFLSAMTWWLGLAYPFVLGSLWLWAWQRRRQSCDVDCLTVKASDNNSAGSGRRTSRHLLLLMTLAAAGLLVFCFADTNHNVGRLSPTELRKIINQNAPTQLHVSILERRFRSMWGQSSETYQSFWVEVRKEGKTMKYSADMDGEARSLIAQKGIPCPTYVQGRDFEILGAPGRLLPFLAAFVLAIGSIFLLKRYRPTSPALK